MRYNLETERKGQIEFFKDYLPLINSKLTMDDILDDYTDGVINGNLLEFKLNISDLNVVLFQAIKYLSARRIKGKELPANIILVSLNNKKAYIYKTINYLEDIEKVYLGSASVDVEGFISSTYEQELDYHNNPLDEQTLINLLREKKFTKINIDENCIVGWAERYYLENPNSSKASFIGDQTGKVTIIGEIRKPTYFKEFINPYKKADNNKFRYLMDKLNDRLQKKNLGAFYTPIPYVKKSHELLFKAIDRVPKGNDYIILDRCAGTGNLLEGLPDEILSHYIVNTYEYYEYKVLLENYADKVRYIVPPREDKTTFMDGLVRGSNALSKEFIENPVIMSYVNDPNCNVIIFENPPYTEANGTTGATAGWKKSFVYDAMKDQIKGTAKNDLANLFIWSAFNYYLFKPEDSFIIYSPIKYWKVNHLIDKKFIDGFIFNRKHFHAKFDAAISCIYWVQEHENLESIDLQPINISNNELVYHENKVSAVKIYKTLAESYYEKRDLPNTSFDGIACNLNGTEKTTGKIRVKTKYHKDMVGFLVANGTGFDNPDLNSGLTVAGRYDSNGCFIYSDTYLEKLPLFAASRYYKYNRSFIDRSFIMKSGDGFVRYNQDIKSGKLEQYLLKVLLLTCFEPQNHMRSLHGSDGRFYRNELCLDTTNGETLASEALKDLKINKLENDMINLWYQILSAAKTMKNYDKKLTYGLYQIDEELNTYQDIKVGRDNKRIYDNPKLNGDIKSLKTLVKEYYNKEIVETLFKYELLK